MVIRISRRIENMASQEHVRQYIYFPLILVFCYIFGICRRFLNLFECEETHCDDFYLFVLMKITMPMQGILNGIYYGLISNENRQYFLLLFTGHKEEKEESSDHDSIELERPIN